MDSHRRLTGSIALLLRSLDGILDDSSELNLENHPDFENAIFVLIISKNLNPNDFERFDRKKGKPNGSLFETSPQSKSVNGAAVCVLHTVILQ